MDVIREDIGLSFPFSSPKANSISRGDEVRSTEVAEDDYIAVEPSGIAYKNAAQSRYQGLIS